MNEHRGDRSSPAVASPWPGPQAIRQLPKKMVTLPLITIADRCNDHDMGVATRMTWTLADPMNPASFAGRARERRWKRLTDTFPDLVDMTVVDLGGAWAAWRSAPVRPRRLVTVNLDDDDLVESWGEHRRADACETATDERFDLVISNSLIEHVGGHARRQRLAEVIHALAPRHWIQTPYRYFPVEPHWMMPGFQFLPFAARVHVTQHWPLGHIHVRTTEEAVKAVEEVELLSLSQMRSYFPDSTIWIERFASWPKSLVAVRTST